MYTLRLFGRSFTIFFFVAIHLSYYGLGRILLFFLKRSKQEKEEFFAACTLALFRRLGATFIKVGQIMSTRPDLFSPTLIKALTQLQDNVGPFDFSYVQKTIKADFKKPIEQLFATFHPIPVASASVAQVHQAWLHTGEKVAIKVRRPFIEKICHFDLAVMKMYAKLLQKIPTLALLAPVESIEEFARAIEMQLDFTIEAQHNQQFRKNFSSDPNVIFPKLYLELCSARVLTMEFIDGVKILDAQKTGLDSKKLGTLGFRIMLKMVFEDGLVHADLHPGNILITFDQKIALLDLGMVAILDDKNRLIFADYFAAWAQGNGKKMAKILLENSPNQMHRNQEIFVKEIEKFVSEFQGMRLGEVQITSVIYNMLQILRKHRVRVNPNFTMVNIAIALTEGVGKQLNPELNLLEEGLPFFAKFSFLPSDN